MRRTERVHRGWTPAAGLVIDVGLVGDDEARRRVLQLYGPGVSVRALEPRRWLVTFAEPRDVYAARAAGGVLIERDGGLSGAPELAAGDGEVVTWQHGVVTRTRVAAAAPIDPSQWLDLTGLTRTTLEPVALQPEPIPEESPLPPPDLRDAAHLPERSNESRAIEEALGRAGRGAGRGSADRHYVAGEDDGGLGLGGLLTGWLIDVVSRTPLADAMRRRELAYLEQLSRQFDGDLDEALRNAIPLGGLGGARTLRLPGRRTHLTFTRSGIRRSSVAFGANAYVHLYSLYRAAADRLAAAGRIEEAAFALVELLNSPMEGVDLLERHGKYELAARIAEDRELDPTVAIRLWWRAGERRRAVALARRHHRFAAAIDRIETIDPAEARDLRLEWVDWLERSGDLLGAVEAGWADRHLRPLLAGLSVRGSALPGPTGAALLAYRLALRPTPEAIDEARALVDEATVADLDRLHAFATALVETDAGSALDREIASRTLRAATRIGHGSTTRLSGRVFRKIRERSDPVLAADLPRVGADGPGGPLTIHVPTQPPGAVEILDAVCLPGGQVLVGLGEAGCRLVTSDGRTITAWEVATHRIVAADHGGAALLIAIRGEMLDVTRLDLTSRRTRHYAAIRGGPWADTFDGSLWQIADARGIAFHDTLADQPTVVWRELEAGWSCLAIARDADNLSALVVIPAERHQPLRVESWRWRVERQTLAARFVVDVVDRFPAVRLLPDGNVIGLRDDHAPVFIRPATTDPVPGTGVGDIVTLSQSVFGVVRDGSTGPTLEVRDRPDHDRVQATIPYDPGGIGMRAVGSLVCVWDETGRIVGLDLAGRRVVALARLRH